MNKLIESDLYRINSQSGNKVFLINLLRNPCFRFLFFLRKVKSSSKISLSGLFYHILYRRYSFKYGIQIPKTVIIGKGFLMPHPGGIVINSKSVIGDNCTILHNVTLGNTKRGNKMGAPTIGNEVYIGPGAVIVGGISIGDRVLIAPNSYVNCDVPANSIVLGNPCRIIPKESATLGYINNKYEK